MPTQASEQSSKLPARSARRASPTRTSARRARCRPRRAAPGSPRRADAGLAGWTSCRRGGTAAPAEAVRVAVAGVIEKPRCAVRVVAQVAAGRRPSDRREQPRRRPCGPPEHGRDELVAIDRERDRAPHAKVGEAPIAEVEGQVLNARAGPRTASSSRAAASPAPPARRHPERTRGSPAELEYPDDLVRYDADRRRARRGAPLGYPGFGSRSRRSPRSADEAEGACPGTTSSGPPREFGRQDPETRGVEERRETARRRTTTVAASGVSIPRTIARLALRRREPGIHDRVEGGLHVSRRDRGTVGEARVGAQAEHVLTTAGACQPAISGTRLAVASERVSGRMEQVGEPPRVRIRAEAGIEALRLARQRHHEPAGGVGARAAGKRMRGSMARRTFAASTLTTPRSRLYVRRRRSGAPGWWSGRGTACGPAVFSFLGSWFSARSAPRAADTDPHSFPARSARAARSSSGAPSSPSTPPIRWFCTTPSTSTRSTRSSTSAARRAGMDAVELERA